MEIEISLETVGLTGNYIDPHISSRYPYILLFFNKCHCFTASFATRHSKTYLKFSYLRTMHLLKNYKVYFGLHPSSGIYDKKSQRFGDWICLRPQVDGAR
jgi:hypothetical protein